MRRFFLFVMVGCLFGCTEEPKPLLAELLKDAPSITGKPEYLDSPFVTAGNRVYMVGHQDGSFPDLGWHIKGEMGGIWNHPIKLMDGFDAKIYVDGDTLTLNEASQFVNFPMANKHVFEFPDEEIYVERWQFTPDDLQGVFIQFLVHNTSKEKRSIFFEFIGHSDLRPTWLGERTDMINGSDVATFEEGTWLLKDKKNDWFAIYGAHQKPTGHTVLAPREKTSQSNGLTYLLSLRADERQALNFSIAGSHLSKEDAISSYHNIHKNFHILAEQKRQRYAALAEQSKLTVPDENLQQTFEWLKYNCDWLVRRVPKIGTGIGAGIPDYPWLFGVDSEYALQGYMAVGQTETVYKTIKLLDSVSMAINGNGKIIHEMSTNGAVFNKGNINETPQFASLIWKIYTWNGDRAFLETYFPTIKKGLEWLLLENDLDKNGFPEGFGMMEIHGLDSEMIDVAAYSQKGFVDAAKIADVLGDAVSANTYEAIAMNLKEKINQDFWSEDFGSYADFIGTDEQALHLIDDAIVRADTLKKPWAIAEMLETKKFIEQNPSPKSRPFVLHHNWVVNTPMEMGIADSVKAIKALNTGRKFVNPFGVFVTGIDRDESAGSNDGAYEAPPIFTYTGAVMTLPTGVQAIAENNYGRPNQALDYLERMTRSFSYALPGSMYEVSPDFGMMTQAWNIYSFAVPIVEQFFGIKPNAAERQVIITPQIPDKWKEASLENVKVGDNEVSIYFQEEDGTQKIKVHQSNTAWTIKVKLPRNAYKVNDAAVQKDETEKHSIFTTTTNELLIGLN